MPGLSWFMMTLDRTRRRTLSKNPKILSITSEGMLTFNA